MPTASNTAFPEWRGTFEALLTLSTPGSSAGFRCPWEAAKKEDPIQQDLPAASTQKKSQISNSSVLFKNQKRIVLQRSCLQPDSPWSCLQIPWELSSTPVDPAGICDSEIPNRSSDTTHSFFILTKITTNGSGSF